MDGHKKYRTLPSAFIPLSRIKHQAVGGDSSYQGIWGSHGITITPILTSLRRQIGDYIDYIIPPSRLPNNQTCVRHNQLLPIQSIMSWVSYPSPYNKNATTHKQLNWSELSHLFGFPSTHCRLSFGMSSFPVAPLQVLDALLQPLYEPLAPS